MDIFAPGLKNHRSVRGRRWAIDRAIGSRNATWTGLQFVVRPSSPSHWVSAFCCCILLPAFISLARKEKVISIDLLLPSPLLSSSAFLLAAAAAARSQTVDFIRTGFSRLTSIIYAPLTWHDPDTGAANVTGVIGSSFPWDRVLNNTLPSFSIIYVVIRCAQLESNFDFADYGYPRLDTSAFTLKVTGVNSVVNVGWGDLRPPPSRDPKYERSFTFQIGENPYTMIVRWLWLLAMKTHRSPPSPAAWRLLPVVLVCVGVSTQGPS